MENSKCSRGSLAENIQDNCPKCCHSFTISSLFQVLYKNVRKSDPSIEKIRFKGASVRCDQGRISFNINVDFFQMFTAVT